MKLLYCNFSNNQRIPILVDKYSGIPIYLPYTYTLIILKGKAIRTKAIQLYAIRLLYQYFDSLGIQFDELIRKNNIIEINDKIDGFCSWLYSRDYQNYSINKPISNSLFDINIRAVRAFLEWCLLRSNCSSNELRILKNKLTVNLIHNPSQKKNYKSLSLEELKHVRKVISITSDLNPFPIRLRLRNYLLVEILLQSGLRLGEILLLKTNDFKLSDENNNYYIEVNKRNVDLEDSRKIRPSVKNSFSNRIVAISNDLMQLIDIYIRSNRKSLGNKLNKMHGFLFISDNGKPINLNTVEYIFKKIETKVNTVQKDKTIRFTPHVLRHTFANQFLEYLIELEKMDMELAKDKLREICGWSLGSPMPTHYAAMFIIKKANQINLTRIKKMNKEDEI